MVMAPFAAALDILQGEHQCTLGYNYFTCTHNAEKEAKYC